MFYFKKKIGNSTAISIKRLCLISIIVIAMLFGFGIFAMKNSYNIAKTEETKIEEIATTDNFSREQDTTSRTSETIDRASIEQENTESVEQTEEKIEEPIEEPSIEISDVEISRDMDLSVRTGLSKEKFKEMISNVKQDTSKFFYDNAETIYDVCEQYSVNEVFFCGLIAAESGWDIAGNHRRTHNYISLMANSGRLIQYDSVEEGLETAARKLHVNYLTPGGCFYSGKTLSGVKKKFCPASSTWVDLVYGNMKRIVK